MTYVQPTSSPQLDTACFVAAVKIAKFRAARSHFDVHVIYDADWGYQLAEVGDYGHLISRIEDKIVHTVLGGLNDEC